MPCSWPDMGLEPLPYQSKYNLFLLYYIILQKWCKANTWHLVRSKQHHEPITQNIIFILGPGRRCVPVFSPDVWFSFIGHGSGRGTDWQTEMDPLGCWKIQGAVYGEAYDFISSASETDSTEANIDSDSDYNLGSLMDTDYERVSDVDNFEWENYPLPESV